MRGAAFIGHIEHNKCNNITREQFVRSRMIHGILHSHFEHLREDDSDHEEDVANPINPIGFDPKPAFPSADTTGFDKNSAFPATSEAADPTDENTENAQAAPSVGTSVRDGRDNILSKKSTKPLSANNGWPAQDESDDVPKRSKLEEVDDDDLPGDAQEFYEMAKERRMELASRQGASRSVNPVNILAVKSAHRQQQMQRLSKMILGDGPPIKLRDRPDGTPISQESMDPHSLHFDITSLCNSRGEFGCPYVGCLWVIPPSCCFGS